MSHAVEYARFSKSQFGAVTELCLGAAEKAFLEESGGGPLNLDTIQQGTARLYRTIGGFPINFGRPHTDTGDFGFVQFDPRMAATPKLVSVFTEQREPSPYCIYLPDDFAEARAQAEAEAHERRAMLGEVFDTLDYTQTGQAPQAGVEALGRRQHTDRATWLAAQNDEVREALRGWDRRSFIAGYWKALQSRERGAYDTVTMHICSRADISCVKVLSMLLDIAKLWAAEDQEAYRYGRLEAIFKALDVEGAGHAARS